MSYISVCVYNVLTTEEQLWSYGFHRGRDQARQLLTKTWSVRIKSSLLYQIGLKKCPKIRHPAFIAITGVKNVVCPKGNQYVSLPFKCVDQILRSSQGHNSTIWMTLVSAQISKHATNSRSSVPPGTSSTSHKQGAIFNLMDWYWRKWKILHIQKK